MNIAQETINEVLLQLSYVDIMNYCATNIQSRTICNDSYFWMNKLDRDFSIIVNGKNLIPSQYVTQYEINNGRETYKRWTEILAIVFDNQYVEMFSDRTWIDKNYDVIIFRVDKGEYNDDILNILMTRALYQSKINVLEWLKAMNRIPSQEDVNGVARYDNIQVLNWLERHGLIPDQEGANFAAKKEKLGVLN